jgi:Fe(3+) dicitrate transport protein
VQKHAGARTIINRNRLDEVAATSIKDALKQVPGVQVQENNGTGGSDVSLNIGVRGLASRLSPRSTVLLDVSFRYTHQDEKNNFELLTYYIDSS